MRPPGDGAVAPGVPRPFAHPIVRICVRTSNPTVESRYVRRACFGHEIMNEIEDFQD
jgi:hypothetical protein